MSAVQQLLNSQGDRADLLISPQRVKKTSSDHGRRRGVSRTRDLEGFYV